MLLIAAPAFSNDAYLSAGYFGLGQIGSIRRSVHRLSNVESKRQNLAPAAAGARVPHILRSWWYRRRRR